MATAMESTDGISAVRTRRYTPARPRSRLGRFARFPVWILDDERFGRDHIVVLLCLAGCADAEGHLVVRQGTIARQLGMSRAWVNRVIGELEDPSMGNVLEQVYRFDRDGRQVSSRYRLRLEMPLATEGAEQQPLFDTRRHSADTEQSFPEQIQESPSETRERAPAEIPDEKACKTVVPGDWRPSEADVAWATSLLPSFDAEMFTARFVNACHAKQYRYVDHSRAWRAWASEEIEKRIRHERNRQQCRAGAASGGEARRGDTNPRAHGIGASELRERNAAVADLALGRILARRQMGGHHADVG
jgi:hypothetical protein